MAMKTSGEYGGPISEINVTPLVDVMLVLLIIFMVTAPLIHQGVEVDLPETETTNAVSLVENDVVIFINPKKTISIGEAEIPAQELKEKLSAIFRNKKKKEVFLQADRSLSYGYVMQIMALIKNAGIERVGMVTESEDKNP
ncbi:MAG: protein TolR [Bdellovibrionales bacterium]|nr:protein TolR [Bdellovibrionales bacterium]